MTLSRLIFYTLVVLYGAFTLYLLSGARRNIARLKVGMIALTTGTWLVSLAYMRDAVTPTMIEACFNGIFVSCLLILGFMYWFSLEFFRVKSRLTLARDYSVLLVAAAFTILFLFTGVFHKEINVSGTSVVEKCPPSEFFPSVLLGFLYLLLNTIANFLLAYRTAKSTIRYQIVYVGISTLAFFLVAFITAALLPVLGINHLIWVAPYGSILYLFGLSYTIIKYRLLEIEILIKRTTIYLSLVAVIVSFYILVLFLPQSFIGPPGSPSSLLFMVVAAIIVAVTIQPLREWLDMVTDRVFYQKKYNYYQFLERLSRNLSTVVKLDELLRVTTVNLVEVMHLDKIGVYLRGQYGRSAFECMSGLGTAADSLPPSIPDDTPLLKYFEVERAPLQAGEFRHHFGHLYEKGRVLDQAKADIQHELDIVLKATLIVPLWVKSNLVGLILLGDKKGGDYFSDRDISLLETIANQMVVVLENTRLYEQMLNGERLRVLGSMSASIAHEIRNPLAAIKTFIQMLPDKYHQPEFRMRFNEIVPSEIERLTRITGDLLTFARPSPPALSATDVNVILERVVTLLASQIRKKQVTVEPQYNPVPTIQADGQQLSQVFMNLVLNAIQASREGGRIWITTSAKVSGADGSGNGQVFISVRDEGVGIALKDMPNMFEPFFTTKHEGSGLGLATSKRIVTAHQGEIKVESVEGHGAAFQVVLPLQPDLGVWKKEGQGDTASEAASLE